MSEPFIGEIKIFAGNFAPRNWALCDGTLLSIAQNSALFSILGTTYGGDGRTTFGLPDMRGRAPMHWGSGPGLTSRSLGERDGAEGVTLTEAQIPAHDHDYHGTDEVSNAVNPSGKVIGQSSGYNTWKNSATTLVTMRDGHIADAGAGLAHQNRQPYLGLYFIVCTVGLFPSRN